MPGCSLVILSVLKNPSLRSALVNAGQMRTAGTSAAALSTDGNATKLIAQPAMPTRGARLTKIVEKDAGAATEDSASRIHASNMA